MYQRNPRGYYKDVVDIPDAVENTAKSRKYRKGIPDAVKSTAIIRKYRKGIPDAVKNTAIIRKGVTENGRI